MRDDRAIPSATRRDLLLSLPNDIGALIFTHLGIDDHARVHAAAKVTRAWSRAALSAVRAIGPVELRNVSGPWLLIERPLRSARVLDLFTGLVHLEIILEIGPASSARPEWERLARASPALRTVRLAGVDDEAVGALAAHCGKLENVDVAGCKALTDAALHALSRSCSSLCELNVSHCAQVTDAGIESIAHGCARLRRLAGAHCGGIGDAAVLTLVQYCSQLQELNLVSGGIEAASLSVAALGAIGSCAALEKLHVSGCAALDDGALLAIASGCARLRLLAACSCARLTDASVGRLGELCPQLRLLALAHCARVTDDAVSALAAALGPTLATLLLARCALVTDRALASLACHCPALVGLHVAHCTQVSDAGVRALARGCARLQYADLSGSAATPAAVAALRAGCPDLRKLVTSC